MLVGIGGGAVIAQRVAAAFVLAVVVDEFGFDFALAGKAAAGVFFLAADADAGVEAVLDLLDDLINVDGAAAVVFVDDFLGALVGGALGAVDGDDRGGAEAGVEVGGRGVEGVGYDVDGVGQGPVGVVMVGEGEVVGSGVGLRFGIGVGGMRALCGRTASG